MNKNLKKDTTRFTHSEKALICRVLNHWLEVELNDAIDDIGPRHEDICGNKCESCDKSSYDCKEVHNFLTKDKKEMDKEKIKNIMRKIDVKFRVDSIMLNGFDDNICKQCEEKKI